MFQSKGKKFPQQVLEFGKYSVGRTTIYETSPCVIVHLIRKYERKPGSLNKIKAKHLCHHHVYESRYFGSTDLERSGLCQCQGGKTLAIILDN